MSEHSPPAALSSLFAVPSDSIPWWNRRSLVGIEERFLPSPTQAKTRLEWATRPPQLSGKNVDIRPIAILTDRQWRVIQPMRKRSERKPECEGCKKTYLYRELLDDTLGRCECGADFEFIRLKNGKYRPPPHPPKKKPRTTELPGQRRMYQRHSGRG